MQGAPGIFEFRVRHDAATILRERGLPVPEHLKREISRIERGQTNPTASTLAALLAPLGARVGVVPREKRDLAHV